MSSSSKSSSSDAQHNMPQDYRSSTPIRGRRGRPILPPPDISSVTSTSDETNSEKLTHADTMESLQEVPEAGPHTSTPRQNVALPSHLPDSPPPAKRSKLEEIVSKRLMSMSVRKSLLETFARVDLNKSVQSEDSGVDDESELSTKKRKPAYKGKDWIMFKPNRTDSIYGRILNGSHDPYDEAKRWIQLYRSSLSQGILQLIQFFADISGYQELDISTKFKYEEENYHELVKFMQDNAPTQQQETGKYLMKCSTDWSKQSHAAIYKFFTNLLDIANSTRVLFDRLLLRHLLSLIVIFTCCINRAMHHTGIVIAIKINTVFLEIQVDINAKIEGLTNYRKGKTEHMEEQLIILRDHKNIIQQVLKKLQDIIESNCTLNDAGLEAVKITYIKEALKWFEIDASLLSRTKYFRRLMVLLQDQSKKVRAAAIEAFQKIVKNSKFMRHINEVIAKLMRTIGERVVDVDYGIATGAVKIYTTVLCKYPHVDTPTYIRKKMIQLMFGDNQQLALASGEFTVELFRRCDDAMKNPATFIKQLVIFNQFPETPPNFTPLLVESMIRFSPELHDWDTMINILLKNKLTPENATSLIEIMSNAAQQTITGSSKLRRKSFAQEHPKAADVKRATSVFLSNLYVLLKKFFDRPKCMRLLTEILLVIDYSDGFVCKYMPEIVRILKVLQSSFIRNSHKKLLEAINNVFKVCCGKTSRCKNSAANIVHTLQETITEVLNTALRSLSQSEEAPQDDLEKVQACTLKLSVLYIHSDLTESVGYDLIFTKLLTLEHALTPESIQHSITCGYLYVLMMLRKALESNSQSETSHDLRNQLEELKSVCSKYLNLCFNFVKHSQSTLIRNEAFDSICKVHLQFRNELEIPMRLNPALAELIPSISERDLRHFMSFAEMLFFKDESATPLKTRQVSLISVINMANFKVFPLQELVKVYKYYHSHNEDYGNMLNRGLQVIRETQNVVFAGIVLHTLTYCFTNLIIEQDMDTTVEQSEATDSLRMLAGQFAQFISRSPPDLKLILQMGIKYALFSRNRYAFLYFIRRFAALLSTDDKKSILEFLIPRIPQQDKDNKLIIGFITYLKSRERTRPSGQQRAVADTTSATTEASQEADIEYEDTEFSVDMTEGYTIDEDSDNPDAVTIT